MTEPAPGAPGPRHPPVQPPPPQLFVPERPETNAPADLIDWGFLVDAVLYLKNSVLRHWFIAIVITGLMSVLAAGAAKIMPRKYRVETRLLTQRNFIISSLANPGRSIPVDADQPTRAAWETIMKTDNMKAIVKQAKLVEYWDKMRSPMSRLKEQLTGKAPAPMADEDKAEALTAMLEAAMIVGVEGGSGTVSIAVEWPDPQLAFDIVTAAQQNFLDMRQQGEMGAVAEAVNILEKQVVDESEGIKKAIAELQATEKRVEARKKREEAKAQAKSGRGTVAQAGGALINTDHLLAQMRFMIQTKRRSIGDVEDFRSRRLTELRNQLSEQRVIYSPQHPVITDLEQRITALQEDSPQLVALRSELTELINEYVRAGGDPAELEAGTTTATMAAAGLGGRASDDPEVQVAADRLRMLVLRYQEKLRRLDQAKTEYEISRASVKHRFSVLAPPTFPEKPSKPKVPLIIAAGVIGGIGLGIFAAVALDIIRRRILEKWQVERILKLPVLAELERR